MNYEIKVIEYITFEKTIYVQANNKKEARAKAKKQDWFDASADGITLDNGVKKVLSIKDYK